MLYFHAYRNEMFASPRTLLPELQQQLPKGLLLHYGELYYVHIHDSSGMSVQQGIKEEKKEPVNNNH